MYSPDLNLYISKSTITGSGNGLFSGDSIPSNVIIGQYKGHIIKNTELLKKDQKYAYTPRFNKHISIVPFLECPFRYANDIIDLKKIILNYGELHYLENISYNIDWLENQDNILIKTIRSINIGDELFINYGSDYWKSFIYKDITNLFKLMNIND